MRADEIQSKIDFYEKDFERVKSKLKTLRQMLSKRIMEDSNLLVLATGKVGSTKVAVIDCPDEDTLIHLKKFRCGDRLPFKVPKRSFVVAIDLNKSDVLGFWDGADYRRTWFLNLEGEHTYVKGIELLEKALIARKKKPDEDNFNFNLELDKRRLHYVS